MSSTTLALQKLFYVDHLSLLMIGLIGFVTLCVASFAYRYLEGDAHQASFYRNLFAMVLSTFIMVSADHMALLLLAWTISNLFLARLMLHKADWEAARQSYLLTLRQVGVGFVCLSGAFACLYHVTGKTSIEHVIHTSVNGPWLYAISALILGAAMGQSALWPFHRWITSSLNSPTPVSAIMHAGLVNGGGFLLTRFSPMLIRHPAILSTVFTLGIATALLGTAWKLMQCDVKRMLACSTMGQMGFMFAQCGLGLFPAAVAHLCWHGLFKSYLFLASGSAAQEKRLDRDQRPSLQHFLVASVCGVGSAYCFCIASGKSIDAFNTNIFLIILSLIAGIQLALPLIREQRVSAWPFMYVATSIMGAFYGFSVHLIEHTLVAMSHPQPLNALHISALVLLIAAWLGFLLIRRPSHALPGWMLSGYVRLLNGSQPHPRTITTHHHHYHY